MDPVGTGASQPEGDELWRRDGLGHDGPISWMFGYRSSGVWSNNC